MATATATRRRKAPVKQPPAPEPEVVEEEEIVEDDTEEVDEEVEELEEDEVEAKPAKRSRKSSAVERAKSTVTFGMAHLAEYLSKETGKSISTRELRQLARKLARDNSGRVDREIVAGNRSRYDWPSIDHPEVQALIKAYYGGELEADKKEKLDALKAQKAAKTAAAKAAPAAKAPVKKTVTRKKAAPVVVEEDDEELDIDDE